MNDIDMNDIESDKSFIYEFSIVLALLAVVIIVLIFFSSYITKSKTLMDAVYSDSTLIQKRLAPLGGERSMDSIGDESSDESSDGMSESADASATTLAYLDGTLDKEKLYQSACAVCHSTKLPNTPQLANKADWAPRISKGKDALYQNAINGINAMPARGASLMSDEQLFAVVDYMIEQSK